MATRRRVLVIDDGELQRFADGFRALDVEVEHLRGVVCRDDLSGPYDVIIATVKRALALEGEVEFSSLPGKPTCIAVHGQDFLPLRVRLLRMGVHFLVQSSVGREALRLLMVHVLHDGLERRSELRLPVGSAVVCRDSAGASFEVELLDLARGGCRMLGQYAPADGEALRIELPSKLGGGTSVELPGHVSRTTDHASGKRLLIVVFDELSDETLDLLDAILDGKVIGTVVTRLGENVYAKNTPTAVQGPLNLGAPTAPQAIPRNNRRIEYTREVTALLDSGEDVVLGRDLSIAGMCVEPRADLPVGLQLELAIYGASGAEPVLVRATVVRNDLEHGTTFQFPEVSDESRKILQTIIETGAEILSLAPGAGDSEAVVVSSVRSLHPSSDGEP